MNRDVLVVARKLLPFSRQLFKLMGIPDHELLGAADDVEKERVVQEKEREQGAACLREERVLYLHTVP